MRQSEALERAIAMAVTAEESARSYGPPADQVRAEVMVAEAWIMIHDRLPVDGLEPEPVVDQAGAYPGITIDGDERAVIETCGHRLPALLHRGRWLHPYSLDECDEPPIADRRASDG